MKTIILLLCLLVFTNAVCAEKVLDIYLNIQKDDSVELVNPLTVVEYDPGQYWDDWGSGGTYHLDLVDSTGKVLFNTSFKVDFTLYSDPPTPLDSAIVRFAQKYDDRMKTMNIFKGDKLIFTTDIVVCNNDGICKTDIENSINCQNDCPYDKKEGVHATVSDSICNPDCKSCVVSKSSGYTAYVQGGESSVADWVNKKPVIKVQDIAPYFLIPDGEEIIQVPIDLLSLYPYPLNAAVVFSGGDAGSVSLVEVSNLSLSEGNKTLTLQATPLEFYDGEVLQSFASEKNELPVNKAGTFNRFCIYIEILEPQS